MDESAKNLDEAVQDIRSVTEELRLLQRKTREYEAAAERLEGLCKSLDSVSASITKLSQEAPVILGRVAQMEQEISASREAVIHLTASVPEIVARLEASEAMTTAGRVADSLASVSELLTAQERSFAEFRSVTVALGNLEDEYRKLKEVTGQQYQLLQLVNQVLVQNVANPISESVRVQSETKHEVRDVGRFVMGITNQLTQHDTDVTKSSKDILAAIQQLREELQATRKAVEELREPVGVAAKKKGLIF